MQAKFGSHITLSLIYAVSMSVLMPDTVFSCQSSKSEGVKGLKRIIFLFAKEKQKASARKEIITTTYEAAFR